MRALLEFLLREPIVALFLIGGLFQLLGQVLNRKNRRPTRSQRAPGGPSAPSPRRPQPTAEEIAADMRRILRMEPTPAPKPAPRPVPRREVVLPEKPPEPLRPKSLGGFTVHGEPHVGDRIQQRKAPASGAVGKSALGDLGGRTIARSGRVRRSSHLVDLTNLQRAIVLREILDRPIGLRGFD